jgi:16S rRNA (cytidine1402-2'-O)-methyltransferase
MSGTLFLIPSLLNYDVPENIPAVVTSIINATDDYVVENEKSARHFLKVAGIKKSFDSLSLRVLDEHTDAKSIHQLLKPLIEGKNIILLSEAGTPAIADPGSDLVRLAHQKNIKVKPVGGMSSIFMALMASGLNGQQFIFHGYLPKEQPKRIHKIKMLEQQLMKDGYTQIFIETPYRNSHLLEDILKECKQETLLCIAASITGPDEMIKTKPISEWKKAVPDIHKVPAVFLLGR